jgi:hypothetical protein
VPVGLIPWSSATRVAALLVTAFFITATVLQLVIVFELLGPRPGGGVDFIDEVLKGFAWEQERWPVEFAATALFGLGFVALGALGALLAGLAAPGDARRSLVRAAFLGAAGLGVASQLLWLGVKPIAANPQLCECGLRAEEIMSRLMILNVAGDTQVWLAIGAVLLVAIGSLLIAPVGRRAGMPTGWAWVPLLIAILWPLAVILHVLQIYPADLIALLAAAGIVVPIWALWIALRSEAVAAPAEIA